MSTGIGPATRRGNLTIVSFNVNGLRSCAPRGVKHLLASFSQSNASTILCVQEIKRPRGTLQRDQGRVEDYHCYFSLCRGDARHGCGTYVHKSKPVERASEGIADDSFFKGPVNSLEWSNVDISRARLQEMDNEGRLVATDHGDFVLINVYVPATSTEDEDKKATRRLFKRDFLIALESRCRQLRKQNREVILVGDLNATYAEQDCARCTTEGTPLEPSDWTTWFRGILGLSDDEGVQVKEGAGPLFLDSFRLIYPEKPGMYSCWKTLTDARAANFGRRLDFILIFPGLASKLKEADVWQHVQGSDHCPVMATFSDMVLYADNDTSGAPVPHPPQCSCFHRDLSGSQSTVKDYFKAASAGGASEVEVDDEDTLPFPSSISTNSVPLTKPIAATVSSNSLSTVPRIPVVKPAAGPSLGLGLGLGLKRPAASMTKSKGTSKTTASKKKKKGVDTSGGKQTKITTSLFSAAVSSQSVSVSMGLGRVAPPAAASMSTMNMMGSRTGGSNNSNGLVSGALAVAEIVDLSGNSGSSNASSDADRPARANPPSAPASSSGTKSNTNTNWLAAFTQKPIEAPLCDCEDKIPTVPRTVKQGNNLGRHFWVCSRGEGARCNFFRWNDANRGFKGGNKTPPGASGKKQAPSKGKSKK